MGKWTRRAFITTGVLAGGVLAIGVAIRPGNRNTRVAGLVVGDKESLINIWLKLAPDNTVTAIIPHAEMGQGVHTTLAMMLADELDADWSLVKMLEAPAHPEYANYALARGYTLGDKQFPSWLLPTVDGFFPAGYQDDEPADHRWQYLDKDDWPEVQCVLQARQPKPYCCRRQRKAGASL